MQSSAQNNILLILDNPISHVSLDAVVFCEQNFIHVLTTQPHSSQKLQLLDRSFFVLLKHFHGVECNNWLTNHPGEVINKSYSQYSHELL